MTWFGCFVVIVDAVKGGAMISPVTFIIFFATPFFVILVSLFGPEDILAALLVLAGCCGYLLRVPGQTD